MIKKKVFEINEHTVTGSTIEELELDIKNLTFQKERLDEQSMTVSAKPLYDLIIKLINAKEKKMVIINEKNECIKNRRNRV